MTLLSFFILLIKHDTRVIVRRLAIVRENVLGTREYSKRSTMALLYDLP
jgi:hypothetical protein